MSTFYGRGRGEAVGTERDAWIDGIQSYKGEIGTRCTAIGSRSGGSPKLYDTYSYSYDEHEVQRLRVCLFCDETPLTGEHFRSDMIYSSQHTREQTTL